MALFDPNISPLGDVSGSAPVKAVPRKKKALPGDPIVSPLTAQALGIRRSAPLPFPEIAPRIDFPDPMPQAIAAPLRPPQPSLMGVPTPSPLPAPPQQPEFALPPRSRPTWYTDLQQQQIFDPEQVDTLEGALFELKNSSIFQKASPAARAGIFAKYLKDNLVGDQKEKENLKFWGGHNGAMTLFKMILREEVDTDPAFRQSAPGVTLNRNAQALMKYQQEPFYNLPIGQMLSPPEAGDTAKYGYRAAMSKFQPEGFGEEMTAGVSAAPRAFLEGAALAGPIGAGAKLLPGALRRLAGTVGVGGAQGAVEAGLTGQDPIAGGAHGAITGVGAFGIGKLAQGAAQPFRMVVRPSSIQSIGEAAGFGIAPALIEGRSPTGSELGLSALFAAPALGHIRAPRKQPSLRDLPLKELREAVGRRVGDSTQPGGYLQRVREANKEKPVEELVVPRELEGVIEAAGQHRPDPNIHPDVRVSRNALEQLSMKELFDLAKSVEYRSRPERTKNLPPEERIDLAREHEALNSILRFRYDLLSKSGRPSDAVSRMKDQKELGELVGPAVRSSSDLIDLMRGLERGELEGTVRNVEESTRITELIRKELGQRVWDGEKQALEREAGFSFLEAPLQKLVSLRNKYELASRKKADPFADLKVRLLQEEMARRLSAGELGLEGRPSAQTKPPAAGGYSVKKGGRVLVRTQRPQLLLPNRVPRQLDVPKPPEGFGTGATTTEPSRAVVFGEELRAQGYTDQMIVQEMLAKKYKMSEIKEALRMPYEAPLGEGTGGGESGAASGEMWLGANFGDPRLMRAAARELMKLADPYAKPTQETFKRFAAAMKSLPIAKDLVGKDLADLYRTAYKLAKNPEFTSKLRAEQFETELKETIIRMKQDWDKGAAFSGPVFKKHPNGKQWIMYPPGRVLDILEAPPAASPKDLAKSGKLMQEYREAIRDLRAGFTDTGTQLSNKQRSQELGGVKPEGLSDSAFEPLYEGKPYEGGRKRQGPPKKLPEVYDPRYLRKTPDEDLLANHTEKQFKEWGIQAVKRQDKANYNRLRELERKAKFTGGREQPPPPFKNPTPDNFSDAPYVPGVSRKGPLGIPGPENMPPPEEHLRGQGQPNRRITEPEARSILTGLPRGIVDGLIRRHSTPEGVSESGLFQELRDKIPSLRRALEANNWDPEANELVRRTLQKYEDILRREGQWEPTDRELADAEAREAQWEGLSEYSHMSDRAVEEAIQELNDRYRELSEGEADLLDDLMSERDRREERQRQQGFTPEEINDIVQPPRVADNIEFNPETGNWGPRDEGITPSGRASNTPLENKMYQGKSKRASAEGYETFAEKPPTEKQGQMPASETSRMMDDFGGWMKRRGQPGHPNTDLSFNNPQPEEHTGVGENRERPLVSRMETEGGRVKTQAHAKSVMDSIQRGYRRNIGVTSAREAIQNAMDAIRGMPKSTVAIGVDTELNEFQAVDTGVGMSPEHIKTKFIDIGNPTEGGKGVGKSGGFGVGIKVPLALSKSFEVVSRWVDPKTGKLWQTTLNGSGEDLFGEGVSVRSEMLEDVGGALIKEGGFSTGTSIKIKFPEEIQLDANEIQSFLQDTLQHNAVERPRMIFVLNGKKVPLTEEFAVDWEGRRLRQAFNYPSKPDTTLTVPGAEVDIYLTTDQENARGGRSAPDIKILNNGLFQLSDTARDHFSPGTAYPPEIVADVRPTVTTGSADYPFTNTREALQNKVEDAIQAYTKTLAEASKKTYSERLADALTKPTTIKSGGGLGSFNSSEGTAHSEARMLADPNNKNPDISEQIAQSHYAGPLARAHKALFDYVRRALVHRGGTYGEHFDGVSFGGFDVTKNLGLNVHMSQLSKHNPKIDPGAADLVLTNPFFLYEESLNWGQKEALKGRKLTNQLTNLTFDTLFHEILHSNARSTDYGGHGSNFAGALTRLQHVFGNPVRGQAFAKGFRERWMSLQRAWEGAIADPEFQQHYEVVARDWNEKSSFLKIGTALGRESTPTEKLDRLEASGVLEGKTPQEKAAVLDALKQAKEKNIYLGSTAGGLQAFAEKALSGLRGPKKAQKMADLIRKANQFLEVGGHDESLRWVPGNKTADWVEKTGTKAMMGIPFLREWFLSDSVLKITAPAYLKFRNEMDQRGYADEATAAELRHYLEKNYPTPAGKESVYAQLEDPTNPPLEDPTLEALRDSVLTDGAELVRLKIIPKGVYNRFQGNFIKHVRENYPTDFVKALVGQFSRSSTVPRTGFHRGVRLRLTREEAAYYNKGWKEVKRENGQVLLETKDGLREWVPENSPDLGNYLESWRVASSVPDNNGKVLWVREMISPELKKAGITRNIASAAYATKKAQLSDIRKGVTMEWVRDSSFAKENKTGQSPEEGWRLAKNPVGDQEGAINWGVLDNHWVHPDVYRDLLVSHNLHPFLKAVKTGGVSKTVGGYKRLMTSLDINAHAEQFMQNSLTHLFNGGSLADVPDAASHVLSNSELFQEFQKLGTFAGTQAQVDLAGGSRGGRLKADTKAAAGSVKDMIQAIQQKGVRAAIKEGAVVDVWKSGQEIARDYGPTALWQFNDNVFRLALAMNLSRNGVPKDVAAEYARTMTYHGNRLPLGIELAKNTIFPWVNVGYWAVKTMPRIMLEHPVRAIQVILLAQAYQAFMERDESEEFKKAKAASRPEWIREKPSILPKGYYVPNPKSLAGGKIEPLTDARGRRLEMEGTITDPTQPMLNPLPSLQGPISSGLGAAMNVDPKTMGLKVGRGLKIQGNRPTEAIFKESRAPETTGERLKGLLAQNFLPGEYTPLSQYAQTAEIDKESPGKTRLTPGTALARTIIKMSPVDVDQGERDMRTKYNTLMSGAKKEMVSASSRAQRGSISRSKKRDLIERQRALLQSLRSEKAAEMEPFEAYKRSKNAGR